MSNVFFTRWTVQIIVDNLEVTFLIFLLSLKSMTNSRRFLGGPSQPILHLQDPNNKPPSNQPPIYPFLWILLAFIIFFVIILLLA